MSNPGVFYPATNDEFLPKSNVDLFREGKFSRDVDVMIGVTEDEGSLFLFLQCTIILDISGKMKTI